MARPRDWEHSLSAATRRAYEAQGRKHGMSASATRSYYENPSNNLGILRRHVTKSGRNVPEHGLQDAMHNPGKYQSYIDQRTRPNADLSGKDTESLRVLAIQNFDKRVGDTLRYDANAVRDKINRINDPALLRRMIEADMEEIRRNASAQPLYYTNPWWYHAG